MTLETAIIQTFENVISAKFEVENNIKFLRVQTNLRDLKQIEELTRKISNFIDNFSSDNNQFYLDVLSQGTDTKLDFAKLKNHINEHIQVWLNKDEFVLGYLLDKQENIITLEINVKGRKKKQNFNLEQILQINSYIKIQKNK